MAKSGPRGRTRRKVVIVGGGAGGASCAARLRRLDEHAEIILVESGPYVPYPNCGLPHLIAGAIPEEADLLATSQEALRGVLGIDVRTRCEATFVSPKKKRVHLRDTDGSGVTTESYDILVLSPCAVPVRPALPGIDLPGIFSLRTIADVRAIREWMARGTRSVPGMSSPLDTPHAMPVRHAVVVGGGGIGLEAAENLARAGFEVTVIEMLDQVLAPLDREFARLVQEHLTRHGVRLALGDPVAGFRQRGFGSLEVVTRSGTSLPADIVILALGVRTDTTLARTAELEIGEIGGIRVDEQMRTSDPSIFAVGDAVEVRDLVTGRWTLLALAGPATRQGRVAADVIAGRDSRFRGSLATSIVRLFGAAVGLDGRKRKAPPHAWRRGLREGLPVPGSARLFRAGRRRDRPEGPLPRLRRARAGRAGDGRGCRRGGQAHQRACGRDPAGRHDPRPRCRRSSVSPRHPAAPGTRSMTPA